MSLLLRFLSRLFAVCLCAALALVGLALAVFATRAHGTISLPALAHDVRLPGLLDTIGAWLHRLEHGKRPIAWLTLAAGAGAVLIGLALLAGALLRRRERLFVLEDGDRSRLAARRKPLTQLLEALAGQTRGVTQASARLRARRRGHGGRLTISAARSASAGDADTVALTTAAVASIAGPFDLRTRVHARAGTGSRRVQ
jgi:hypothetical protein